MDPMMEIFWMLWMFVLPIVGITLTVLAPVFWFIIVPKIARKLTWERFRNVSYHFIGDASGYAYLESTKIDLPEGVQKTGSGWRFLPRPRWKSPKKSKKTKKTNPTSEMLDLAEKHALKKYVWKDMSKPVWFDYAGKVASVNPATLATLQQTKDTLKLDAHFSRISEFVKDMPKHFQKPLTKMLDELQKYAKAKPLTLLDPTAIKEVIPQMYTPSQLDALATNRETYGRKRTGRQYTSLILGATIVVGILVFGIIAIMLLTG